MLSPPRSATPSAPIPRVVYKALHQPMTICGMERRLFFLGLAAGVISLNLFQSLVTALLLATLLFLFGLWATRTDPQLLRIVSLSARARVRYDPAKHDICVLRIAPPC